MPPEIITSIEAMQAMSQQWQEQGLRCGFVPTMGNLHAGHLKLVEEARKQADRIVVSIFVNPLQFGPNEDFAKYPRTLQSDVDKLEPLSVDVVFAPDEKRFYPKPSHEMSFVEVPGLSDILCGASRPGHFRGVTTVVNKLFNIVQPDVAVFGLKDFQQFTIIQQMVNDLAMPIKLIGVETERETDGLAMSSRNGYLDELQRMKAAEIYKVLLAMKQQIRSDHQNLADVQQEGIKQLNQSGFRVDYLEIRNAQTLLVPESDSEKLVILTAVYLGETRLIDNIRV